MINFRILRPDSGYSLKVKDLQVDTSGTGAATHADLQTRTRIVNPFFGVVPGVSNPWLLDHTSKRDVQAAPSSALNDAIAALQELGAANQVIGVSLPSADSTSYGAIMFADATASYQSGSGVEQRIGSANAWQIDAAAKRVLELLKV